MKTRHVGVHRRVLTSVQSHRISARSNADPVYARKLVYPPIHFINFGAGRLLSPLSRCVILQTQAFNPHRKVHLWSSTQVNASLVSAPWLSSDLAVTTHTIHDGAELFKDTPLFDWYERHIEFHDPSGPHRCPGMMGQNIANGLRLVLLWRYGGVYLDSDVIPIQQLPAEWVRAVCEQKPGESINNAAIFFPRRDPCLHALMLELSRRFDPCRWGEYGPRLFSNVIGPIGRSNAVACRNVTILPPWTVAPLPFTAFRDRAAAMASINATVVQGWRADGVVGMHAFNAMDSLVIRRVHTEVEELTSAAQCLSMPRPDAIRVQASPKISPMRFK
eukprot:4873491-Pleurochrysis_carterae.AAC.3